MNVPKGIFSFVSNYYIISPKKERIVVYVNAGSVRMLPGVLCVFALINNIDLLFPDRPSCSFGEVLR